MLAGRALDGAAVIRWGPLLLTSSSIRTALSAAPLSAAPTAPTASAPPA